MKRSRLVVLCLVLAFVLSACATGTIGNFPGRGPATSDFPTVDFGHYDSGSGSAPIQWYLLDSSGDEILLLSARVLASREYDNTSDPWESSEIRTWLNGTFYDSAFSAAEKNVLLGTDKVMLLSSAQAQNPSYFGNSALLIAYDSSDMESSYWLSDSSGGSATVVQSGSLQSISSVLPCGVRPVIRIDKSKIPFFIASNSLSMPDGALQAISAAPPSAPYALVVPDSTLPTLAVSSCTISDTGVLTIVCPSVPTLAPGQEIYCYMRSLIGGNSYLGEVLVSGTTLSVTSMDNFPAPSSTLYDAVFNDYEVVLAVGVPGASLTGETFYVGPAYALALDSQTPPVEVPEENPLVITASPAGNAVFVGGSITLTPSVLGGAWSYDSNYFSLSGNTFTAKKAGQSTVTYTINGKSASYTLNITVSMIPQTGDAVQEILWALLACSMVAFAASVFVWVRRRRS